MKLTKRQLKRLIKEELNNVLNETLQPDPTRDLAPLIANIQACVAKGGWMQSFKCMPIAMELAAAVVDEDWMKAMQVGLKLQSCIPRSCSGTVRELIRMLKALGNPGLPSNY